MQRVVRAFPVKDKESLRQFGREIEAWSAETKRTFFSFFGSAREAWYFQEIDGKPHIIAVSEGEALNDGFVKMAQSTDEFTIWFRRRVMELSVFDLSKSPRGPASELIFEWSSD
jgi:hypothetical protein